ncbi:8381_t:CDS:2 [Funneliformis geosporum]|nr:8381_t:CDS:2 [Funneliformis geosporum]
MTNDININWLNNAIANGLIKSYKHSNFKNKQTIGHGSYGTVHRAFWNNKRLFAVKTYNNQVNINDVVKEFKLHWNVNDHDNIIRLYGVTMVKPNMYSLVLEYADCGTLNDYLKKYFSNLNWDDKYQLAFQLSSAVEYLHEEDIIHRDLHAGNILLHRNQIKLADFGLSRKVTEDKSNTASNASCYTQKLFGVVPYLDPKRLRDNDYRLDKKSDVYSIGVLMWQISSGNKPFHFDCNDIGLIHKIVNGKRETIIYGTPIQYSKLIKRCWTYEPNERPDIQEVVSTLDPKQSNSINDNIYEEDEINNDDKELSKNQNKSHYIWLSGLFNYYNIGTEGNRCKAFELFSKASEKNCSIAQVYLAKCYNDEKKLNLAFKYYKESEKNGSNIGRYYLAKCYQFGIGTRKDHAMMFELYQLAAENENSAAQNDLGLLYERKIKERNLKKAFYWYNKAAKNGNVVAQYNLGRCFQYGIGNKKDEIKAFINYKKSADNGYVCAIFRIGHCYDNGIGTYISKNEAKQLYCNAAKNESNIVKNCFTSLYENGQGIEKAIYWHHKAAKRKVNKVVQYNMGRCCRFGNCVEKDAKACVFNNGYILAQYYLCRCFQYGIGNKKDEIKAFINYKKSADNGYVCAIFRIGHCYDNGIGTYISKNEAKQLYCNAAKNESNIVKNCFTSLYENGQGIEKAIYWHHKAAKRKVNKVVQYNMGRCCRFGNCVEKDAKACVFNNGYILAQYYLCYLYEKIKKDLKQTIYWYNKAADIRLYNIV